MKGKRKRKNIIKIIQVLLLTVAPVFCVSSVSALSFLTQRTVSISSPIAGAITDYNISFRITTPGTLGSIQIQFCDNSPLLDIPCNDPPGLSVNTAVLSNQTGETGFSSDPSSSASNIILSRPAQAAAAVLVSYKLDGVTNPAALHSTTYVRITTYASVDASGPLIDQGAAAFSTSGQFGASAFVPPRLHFCTGVTVALDCSATAGDAVTFGDLSTQQTKAVTTQFAAATNDPTGYVIYMYGNTLTSGNNTIPSMSIQNPSLAGTSQFGINLRSNNNPNFGQNVFGAGSGYVAPKYSTANLYAFGDGDILAQSNLPTEYNIYTVTYIANLQISQPKGVYITTLNYTAVAQF